MLCRLDAAYALPLMLGAVLHLDKGDARRTLILMFFGALSVATVSAVSRGFSLADSLVVANQVLSLLRATSTKYLSNRLLFFGLAGLPMLLIGGWLSYRAFKVQGAYIAIATFIVYPLLLTVLAPKLTEIRYVLPLLAPLVAMYMGNALHWVYAHWTPTGSAESRIARAVAAFALAVMVVPPTVVTMRDGPRTLLGRFWSPVLWMEWQRSVDESMGHARELAAKMESGRQTNLISTHYNDELYLRLRLMERGFLPTRLSDGQAACKGFSVFTKAASTVFHVRSHPHYNMAGISHPYNAALQLTSAFDCPFVRQSDRTFVSTWGMEEWVLSPDVYSFTADSFAMPLVAIFHDSLALEDKPSIRVYGRLGYRELGREEISASLLKAQRFLVEAPEGGTRMGSGITIDEYIVAYQALEGPTMRHLQRRRQE
jgi:hypothetical protein